MKVKKINKKLELKKETISTLDNVEMAAPKGGGKYTAVYTLCVGGEDCNTVNCTTPETCAFCTATCIPPTWEAWCE
ncbi:MAG: class I lanthipeptide [Candidatus Aminicenantes bacterium]|nr:class I lanthipeptide [Candidatus Aminicenantes bacterium]